MNIKHHIIYELGLPRNYVKQKWDDRRDKVLKELNLIFLFNLKIYYSNYKNTFILRTDVSIARLAGVLLQKDGDIEYHI